VISLQYVHQQFINYSNAILQRFFTSQLHRSTVNDRFKNENNWMKIQAICYKYIK